MTFKRKGDKARYSFVDAGCMGRKCFQPGMYQHRSPLSSGGSRNTGSPDSPTCMQRAYRGCPDGPVGAKDEYDADLGQMIHLCGLPEVSTELMKLRRAEGWKVNL